MPRDIRGLNIFFKDQATSKEVLSITTHDKQADAIELASPEGGRVSSVIALKIKSTTLGYQDIKSFNDATYFRWEASIVSDTGPWTDITSGSLPISAPIGTYVNVWFRYVVGTWAGNHIHRAIEFIRVRGYEGSNFLG